jgi:hypothetical protein
VKPVRISQIDLIATVFEHQQWRFHHTKQIAPRHTDSREIDAHGSRDVDI